MRILGIDLGEKRIGFAISDRSGKIALGLHTYKRKGLSEDFEHIKSIVIRYDVEEIVIGMPYDMKGRIGKNGEKIREFAEDLKKLTQLPVTLWDERFSTNEAHRVFDMGELSHKKRKKFLDIVSAQIILQGYLDAKKGQ